MVRGLVALLSVIAGSRSAAADPVRLEVTRGACDFATLESQLTEILGSNPVDPNASASVRVTVMQLQEKLEARVTFDDGDRGVRGPRIVTATNCSDLVKSVALVVAMGLPELSGRLTTESVPSAPVPDQSALETADQPPPSPAPVPASTLPARLAPERPLNALGLTADDSTLWRAGQLHTDFFVAGAGGFTSGGVQGQLIVGVRAQRGSASLTAEVRADVPEEHEIEPMASIRVFRTQVSVSPCLHAGSLAGCAMASAGTIHGAGIGLTSPRSVFTPLVAGGLRLTWEYRLVGAWTLHLHLDADTLLTTTQFDVDNMKAWVSPRFEGAAGVGVLAHFP